MHSRLQLSHRTFNVIALVVLIVSLAALIATCIYGRQSFDSFWHLQMGRDWLENGLNPWVDHYSFTYYGHAIINPPVLFQSLLHLSVKWLGMEPAFITLRLVGFSLTLIVSAFLLKRLELSLPSAALVLTLVAFMLQLRGVVRPEMFSYPLMALALVLYFRLLEHPSRRGLALIALLMWIWSLYHSSIVGYVIFAGYFVDSATQLLLRKAPAREWAEWGLGGLVVLLVGFLNPSGSHSVLEAATHPDGLKAFVAENASPLGSMRTLWGVWVLLAMTLVTALLSLRERRLGFVLVLSVLFFAALNMQRMVAPAGLVVALLFAWLVRAPSANPARQSIRPGKMIDTLAAPFMVLASLLVLHSQVVVARGNIRNLEDELDRFPEALTEYLFDRELGGKIFNDHRIGGYLIYRLSPQNTVYIDGRTNILYPLEHALRWKKAIESPEALGKELSRYEIDHIVLQYPESVGLVAEAGGFELDFVDRGYALYRRPPANFPLYSRLVSNPACFHSEHTNDYETERQKMSDILPHYSALLPFADLVFGALHAEDEKAFFDREIDQKAWTDPMRRFAGFRMLKMGEFGVAGILFWSVEKKKGLDYLAEAYAMGAQGRSEVIGRILHEWLKNRPFDLSAHESRVLLQVLRMNEGVVHQNAWLADLASKVEQQPESETSAPPTAEMFCPSESG